MTPEEFTRLYLPLGDGLYRAAFRLLGSQEEAEDAVQDLFFKLWNNRDSLDGIRSPKAWSLTLLRNLCIDRIRAGSGATRQAVPEELAEQPPPEWSERQDRILRAVSKLPERERELLRLRLLHNLPWEKIARQTGMTEGALRVAFHRLKNKIKRNL